MSEIRDVERIAGDISVISDIDALISAEESMEVSLNIPAFASIYYDGEYSVTASDETQTLLTQGRVMRNNLTINPVPSSYGRITWDGNRILVS